MSTIWFTSDLHLNHEKVARLRGFDSTEEHDADVEHQFDCLVQPDDIVWILGDVVMGRVGEGLERIASWPGHKRLISGNHDGTHPMNRRAPREMRRYSQAFEFIASAARVALPNGGRALLSHFPYSGDTPGRLEDRFTQWRLPDEGVTLLHGHTHDPLQGVHLSDRGTPQLHVGWDDGHTLFSADDVVFDLEWR